jgi:NAD(P)-dependent dehydrogenase (short-subunit alcohol dehydrogenase family)
VAGFDVTQAQAVRDGVEAIEKNSGAIDILVTNAGMQFRAPFEDFRSRNGSNCSRPIFRARSMSAKPSRVT